MAEVAVKYPGGVAHPYRHKQAAVSASEDTHIDMCMEMTVANKRLRSHGMEQTCCMGAVARLRNFVWQSSLDNRQSSLDQAPSEGRLQARKALAIMLCLIVKHELRTEVGH